MSEFKYPKGYFDNKDTKLEATASSEFKSEASVQNEQEGICPKCEAPMSLATIANGDRVHYCNTCRVSTPKSDQGI